MRDFLKKSAGDVVGVLEAGEGKEAGGEEYEMLMEFVIAVRAKAREEKQWQLSDFIRDGLKDLGLQIEDGKSGTTWKRIR